MPIDARHLGHRRTRAVAALGLSLWSFACTTYAAPRAGRPLQSARQARVQAVGPITLSAPAGSLTAMPLCRVTRIDGSLARVVGDTLVFDRVDHVTTAAGRDMRCPRFEGLVTLVRTPDVQVTERRFSKGRTAALVLGLLAVLVAFVAIGASQIEPGFPDDSGGIL